MPLMSFIGWAAPYVVGLFLISCVGLSLVSIFKYKDHKMTQEEIDALAIEETASFKVNPLKAIAPLVPMGILIVCSLWFPKSGIDVVTSMIIGVA